MGLGPLIQGSASQGAGPFVCLVARFAWTARHAACKLRGKRRAGLRRAEIRGRQTASASSGRLAQWLRSSSVPSVPARTPPLRPSPPNSGGQGLAAPQRAAPCLDSPPPDCLRKLRQTGSVPLAGLVTLCYRLRGATDRLGYRPARRAPALRWSFPPPIAGGSGKGSVPPTQPGSVVGN